MYFKLSIFQTLWFQFSFVEQADGQMEFIFSFEDQQERSSDDGASDADGGSDGTSDEDERGADDDEAEVLGDLADLLAGRAVGAEEAEVAVSADLVPGAVAAPAKLKATPTAGHVLAPAVLVDGHIAAGTRRGAQRQPRRTADALHAVLDGAIAASGVHFVDLSAGLVRMV